MSKPLQKHLKDYISKMKKHQSFSHRKNWIPSRCKHPRTLSFAIDPRHHEGHDKHKNDESATLTDVDRFLLENFKSLYITEIENNEKKESEDSVQAQSQGGFIYDSPRFFDIPPDLGGSHRFFVAPGMSGSLMEEARSATSSIMMTNTTYEDMGSSSMSTNTLSDSTTISIDDNDDDDDDVTLPDECIAVLKYSPTPHNDFRCSMQEVVEEKLRHHGKVDWDFMEEILFCYLNLNEKKSHKFILSAFVDLIVVLRKNPNKVPARSQNFRAPRERRRKVLRIVK